MKIYLCLFVVLLVSSQQQTQKLGKQKPTRKIDRNKKNIQGKKASIVPDSGSTSGQLDSVSPNQADIESSTDSQHHSDSNQQQAADQSSWSYLTTISPVLIALVLIYMLGRGTGKSAKKEKAVIIAGECDSGKTSLQYYLAKSEIVKTVTSMEKTDAVLQLNKLAGPKNSTENRFRFLDIPGHVNFRHYLFDELESTSAIIFLIDSTKRYFFGFAKKQGEYLQFRVVLV